MRIMRSNLRIASPQATISDGASACSCCGLILRATAAMLANGFATSVLTWVRLATTSSTPGIAAQPPESRMWLIWLYWVEVKKNCSARATSSAERVHERAAALGFVVLGQAAGALGGLGFFGRQAEVALDLLRELVAAERLLAHVDRLVVAQHVDVHDGRADVDDRRCSGPCPRSAAALAISSKAVCAA